MLASASYASAGLNFLTTIMVARLVGPSDYGFIALVMAYPTLVWSLVSVKSVSVTIRYIAGARVRGEKQVLAGVVKLGFAIDFVVSAVCLLVVGLTAHWVNSYFYRIPNLALFMAIYASSFLFYSMAGTSRAIFTSWENFKALALFQVLESVSRFALSACFLLLGLGVLGIVVANSLGHIIIGTAMAITATNLLFEEGIGMWWRESLSQIGLLRKELTRLFGWNYLFVTLNGFVEQLPLMLLGVVRGAEEAGFYRLALNIKTTGSTFEGSMGGVAYPTLSARWALGERESINQSLKHWTCRGGVPIATLELLAIPLLPFIVPLVFGADYKPAVLGVQILMGASAIRALFFWLNSFYYASGKISLWVKGFALHAALLVGLGWVGIQYAGFLGMVLVYALAGLAFTLVMAGVALRRGFSFSPH